MAFTRGIGPTSNKFTKKMEDNSTIHLKVGRAPDQWSVEELKEILEFFEKPADKEIIDVIAPNAKRGPGRSRKTSGDVDKA